MSTASQLLTADDLWNLSDRNGRYELVRGELRAMTPAGFDHGAVTSNLSAPLALHVKVHRLGIVVAAETGFVISRDPDTVRAPDIGFIRRERLPAEGRPIKFWPGAPDLAVETISPSDTVFEVDEKVDEWLGAGAEAVWVLNPRQKSVRIHRADRTVQILSATDVLDGEQLVPGFRIAVSEIFE
jgi:Uma2 family endonuclease